MFIADLHIHSKYARATSSQSVPEYLDLWARRKGIDLVGTGDFTHPGWRQELRDKLVPDDDGLYALRDDYRLADPATGDGRKTRFVLSGEISSIYKKDGRVRKVHNVILLPGLEPAEALARRLETIGNVHSDGRPILGLDSRDLLEITLEVCPEAVFIPAHIWTPHFSLFGAFSGFDTIEACYGDMTPYIHALETGLSSDPPMNWRLSALDRYTLVSNSDAHSPSKLGREANCVDAPLSYDGLARALQCREAVSTIEFFPEEGKYHYDGHRNCGVCLRPGETLAAAGRCPVCGKKLTVGVLHRVEELADRPEGVPPDGAARFESLVPLPEIIAASTGFSEISQKGVARYETLLHELGPEFTILRTAPLEQIERVAGPCVAEGVRRVRTGQVDWAPGFDGEYGKIHILDPDEMEALSGQLHFLDGAPAAKKPAAKAKGPHAAAPYRPHKAARPTEPTADKDGGPLAELNEEQRRAVSAAAPALAVVAGPGTGKTKTLVARIAYLVEQAGARPSEITAVTFTNQAAAEMRARLEQRLGKRKAGAMRIGTFHAICLRLLEEHAGAVTLVDEYEALALAGEVARELESKLSARQLVLGVSLRKNGAPPQEGQPVLPEGAYERYCARLRDVGVLDFDDLLLQALALSEAAPQAEQRGFAHLLVDEFQDINDLQYLLVRAWSKGGRSLFVIGDPDQSIYGFRGSNARCFTRLADELPALETVRLTRNYRSTPEIVRCALPVIARNGGDERALDPQRPAGEPVRLLTAPDEFAEAIFIAKEIGRMVGGVDMLEAQADGGRERPPRGFGDIAVLYRTHRQASALEKYLGVEGIPYVVVGRDKLLAADAVRGAIGFFRQLLQPQDAVSLRACLRALGCSDALARDFAPHAAAPEADRSAAWALLQTLPERFRASEALQTWAALCARYAPRAAQDKPRALLEGWARDVGLAGDPDFERLEGMAVYSQDLASFLQTLSLGQERDVQRSGSGRYLSDAVSLMTLHGAKGLEFPVVFLSGLRRGVLPLEAPGRPAELEEERRLFYVGLTRAREELVLLTGDEPSSFLADIPPAFVERGGVRPDRVVPVVKQMSLFGV